METGPVSSFPFPVSAFAIFHFLFSNFRGFRMTAKRTLEFVFAALLAVALALALNAWHGAALERAALDATLKTGKADQADLAKQSAAVIQDLKERVAALEQVKAQAVTPAQIVREIPTFLPQSLPAPVATITAPAPAGSPPNTPPQIAGLEVPAVDMKPLFDQLVDCKECAVKLAAAEGQESIDADKIKSLTTERDAALKAAKGGSVWHRVKDKAETIVVTGAIVYALAKAKR
jgi:hypothetical protein